MKGLSTIKFIFVFILFTFQHVLLSQISVEPEQQEYFDDLRNDLDFSDTKNKWTRKETKKKEKEIDPIDYDLPTSFNIDGGITNSIAYILIVVLILAVLFMIFGNVNINKKIEKDIVSDDYIEDIEEIDTIDGFNLALRAGDFRSAIRMQFIKVLQLLQEKNKINWRPEKTNRDYLRELSGSQQKNDFRKLSGIYELVWYGNTKIERDSFEQLNPAFDKFINDFDGE